MAGCFKVAQNIFPSLVVAQKSLCTNIALKPMGKCKTHMTIHLRKGSHFSIYFELASALSLQVLYQKLVWQRGNREAINDLFHVNLALLAIQNIKITSERVLFLIKFEADVLQNNKNNSPPDQFLTFCEESNNPKSKNASCIT